MQEHQPGFARIAGEDRRLKLHTIDLDEGHGDAWSSVVQCGLLGVVLPAAPIDQSLQPVPGSASCATTVLTTLFWPPVTLRK